MVLLTYGYTQEMTKGHAVSIETKLGAGGTGVRISLLVEDFRASETSRPSLGPTQPHIKCVFGFFAGCKAAGTCC
jgi:hypothetical protein